MGGARTLERLDHLGGALTAAIWGQQLPWWPSASCAANAHRNAESETGGPRRGAYKALTHSRLVSCGPGPKFLRSYSARQVQALVRRQPFEGAATPKC